ncbi:hypothetical protein [Microlunatus soli]|uniref:Uncharacterized protein n=1 Tax=Microlunatus soli TaxID=630515 RepID=A0A1H1NJ01_9ACTN|nr:hypothetical protein [Microlunatus soli]SDR98705.1 hypothetical protein SAMN04489812_0526 [Microlunatus soli]
MSTETVFRFSSDAAMNLHHVLYSEACAAESAATGARPRAQHLEGGLTIRGSAAYEAAVDYYRHELITRDLLFDSTMRRLSAEVAGLGGTAPHGWSDVFQPALGDYLGADWSGHDATNVAWTVQLTDRLAPLLPDVVGRLEQVYRTPLPDVPVPVSTVVVGRTEPAYTAEGPDHITCTTTHRKSQGLQSVEIVLHELSHLLAGPLYEALAARATSDERPDLWHVVLFYLTGQVVARAWADHGVDYLPYLDATGLFDRAWPDLRQPVGDAWNGYLDGTRDWDSACDQVVDAVNDPATRS